MASDHSHEAPITWRVGDEVEVAYMSQTRRGVVVEVQSARYHGRRRRTFVWVDLYGGPAHLGYELRELCPVSDPAAGEAR